MVCFTVRAVVTGQAGQAGSRDQVWNGKKEGEREVKQGVPTLVQYNNESMSTPGRHDREVIT